MLKGNISKQKKLTSHSPEGLIADEVFRDKSLELKEDEKNIKAKIASARQRIIEKKNSVNYAELVKELLGQLENVKENLDVNGKKMLLKVVFKTPPDVYYLADI